SSRWVCSRRKRPHRKCLNAIKFRGREPLRIQIEATREERAWRFTVRDNGIGFDPKYAERIFLIFQRLHDQTEFPGAGIGLAICKRIVERHGGRIWAESAPGRGSAFHFTIPDQGGQMIHGQGDDVRKND
ncbi:MAG: sensor histidine kinase, partial [Bacillota bacterium]